MTQVAMQAVTGLVGRQHRKARREAARSYGKDAYRLSKNEAIRPTLRTPDLVGWVLRETQQLLKPVEPPPFPIEDSKEE